MAKSDENEKAVAVAKDKSTEKDISVEQKLVALCTVQQIDTQIDKIRIIRGELPLEVQDLEDEIAGLETRIKNYSEEMESIQTTIEEKKQSIKDSTALIKKYESQQKNVRNNREYDSINKELEFQNLEIQLCEKRINEFKAAYESKMDAVTKYNDILEEQRSSLHIKKSELNDIIAETEKEENMLLEKSKENKALFEERLLNAYSRIRANARNGLAVVMVERDACGGCFNKIPPQRQLDIRMHKKIIVCEYCGRILVDEDIVNRVNN